MATFGDMQTRIQSEVLGSPTNAQIQTAIQDAIAHYEREAFYFNELYSNQAFSTVAGKEWYADDALDTLPLMPHIEKIMVVAFGNRYPLEARTPQWIDDESLSLKWMGLPTDWAWYSSALRLYPVPDNAYPIILTGTMRFPTLSNDSDFNPWMQDAEELIRCRAKFKLFAHITRDPEMAQAMKSEEQDALKALRRENTGRAGGPGRIRPSRGHF